MYSSTITISIKPSTHYDDSPKNHAIGKTSLLDSSEGRNRLLVMRLMPKRRTTGTSNYYRYTYQLKVNTQEGGYPVLIAKARLREVLNTSPA